jgi:AP-3 complex subunit mu
VISVAKYNLVHIQVSKLFFLAVTQHDTDALLIIEFLMRLEEIFKFYFVQQQANGAGRENGVSEAVLKENFMAVYQLLDEVNDGGIPFTVEPNILRELISPPSLMTMLQNTVMGPGQNVAAILPSGSLTNVYWRRANARYTTNEIYFDLVETVHCVVDRNGMLAQSEVHGEAQVNCHLTGMPDLLLKFTNTTPLDDVSLHPCVRISRWEQDRVISFIPPDGEFTLMTYRVVGNIQLPLYVKPTIMYSDVGAKVHVQCGTKINSTDKPVDDVVITIPFSKSTATATLSTNYGAVSFDDQTKVATWIVGKLKGSGVPTLEGTTSLQPGCPKPESNPTLLVDFKVTMWAASGIKVDSLTITNEKYSPYKGVRTITRGAGHVQVRS